MCFKMACPLGLFFLALIVSVSMATTAGSDVLLSWQPCGPPFKGCSETGMHPRCCMEQISFTTLGEDIRQLYQISTKSNLNPLGDGFRQLVI